MACRVVLRRRDCRRVCRVQMLPELRATLFGTNPNRKHVDWSEDDLAIVGPGATAPPSLPSPLVTPGQHETDTVAWQNITLGGAMGT